MSDPAMRKARAIAARLNATGVTADASTRRRAEYSSDASNYRIVPAAIAFPRSAEDVQAALGVAGEFGVPITSRGGGTSTAGNSVGAGIVLDFSRHLNRIVDVRPEERLAIVEPGAVLDDITAASSPYGLRFGPDPSTHARATIGGSIGNNACGSRALAYGRTADNVVELEVMGADGTCFTARRQGSATPADGDPAAAIVNRLRGLVGAHLATIRTEFGRFTRQVSGYSLEHLLPENGLDLARFLVGTEGTLGIVIGATVRLVESPKAKALAVLGYADMPTAADDVLTVLPHRPTAVEGMDARLVQLVRRRRGDSGVPPLPDGGGWLLVETTAATAAEALSAAKRIVSDAHSLDATILTGKAAAALWRIREDGAGLGGRTSAGTPAWPGWEDAAVPPDRLGSYLREFETLLRAYHLDGLTYGHFGEGCVHARLDFPLADEPRRLRDFLLAAADLVARHGGSMSGEHGDGRARGELLPRMYSPEAIALFAATKNIFDPSNRFNPGVIVDPAPLDADLRLPAAAPLRGPHGFSFPRDHEDLAAAVHRCVGVGKCRADTSASGEVMCPSYLATRDEKDSTRGRARVLQELANGSLVRGYRSVEVAQALDLCLSCKGCSADCPAGVDMATYKSEVLYRKYRHRLRPASHYTLGQLPRLARLASRSPRLVNAFLEIGPFAKLAKRLGGIDARRPLPQFVGQTFRDWFAQLPAEPGRPVLLWVDTFTEHFAPEVGKAAVAVLRQAGYAPELTSRPQCCGLTWISTGQLDGARRQLRRTLDALDTTLAEGTPIVGLEPSCTAVLRHDLPDLLPHDPRAQRVAATTHTLAELLRQTKGWRPPRLDGIRALAQPHCHQHAVMGWDTDAALLADAGAEVEAVGGCCGLAGNFGVERGHYEVSVAVAEHTLLPAVRSAPNDAVILADGFSCRTQLDQLGQIQGQHLAELLANASKAPTTN